MYAVHTTAKPEWHKFKDIYTHEPQVAMEAAGDCFYGFGERADRKRGCIGHTVLYGLDLDEARRWAHILVGDGYQVVVTRDEDWSVVVMDAQTPIYSRASHTH